MAELRRQRHCLGALFLVGLSNLFGIATDSNSTPFASIGLEAGGTVQIPMGKDGADGLLDVTLEATKWVDRDGGRKGTITLLESPYWKEKSSPFKNVLSRTNRLLITDGLTGFSISGKVFGDDFAELEGARILIGQGDSNKTKNDPLAIALTDSRGVFSISGILPGKVDELSALITLNDYEDQYQHFPVNLSVSRTFNLRKKGRGQVTTGKISPTAENWRLFAVRPTDGLGQMIPGLKPYLTVYDANSNTPSHYWMFREGKEFYALLYDPQKLTGDQGISLGISNTNDKWRKVTRNILKGDSIYDQILELPLDKEGEEFATGSVTGVPDSAKVWLFGYKDAAHPVLVDVVAIKKGKFRFVVNEKMHDHDFRIVVTLDPPKVEGDPLPVTPTWISSDFQSIATGVSGKKILGRNLTLEIPEDFSSWYRRLLRIEDQSGQLWEAKEAKALYGKAPFVDPILALVRNKLSATAPSSNPIDLHHAEAFEFRIKGKLIRISDNKFAEGKTLRVLAEVKPNQKEEAILLVALPYTTRLGFSDWLNVFQGAGGNLLKDAPDRTSVLLHNGLIQNPDPKKFKEVSNGVKAIALRPQSSFKDTLSKVWGKIPKDFLEKNEGKPFTIHVILDDSFMERCKEDSFDLSGLPLPSNATIRGALLSSNFLDEASFAPKTSKLNKAFGGDSRMVEFRAYDSLLGKESAIGFIGSATSDGNGPGNAGYSWQLPDE
jgi:hypothetical protein